MTFTPPNSIAFTVPEIITFSKEHDQFLKQITSVYQSFAKAINGRDISTYDLTEILNGQAFPGATPQTKKNVYRKIFEFGAIAQGATLALPHGIAPLTQFTRIYGTCITDQPDFRPIPFADVTLVTNQIMVTLDAVNYNIVNGATAPNILSGILVLEYLKN